MSRIAAAIILASLPGIAAAQHLMEGAAQSPVRVIIYEDLQCPDCAVFRNMLDDQLLPKYKTTVRFEHRDFPLAQHAWARKAAIAARFFEESKPGLGLAYRKDCLTNLGQIKADTFDAHLAQFARANAVDPVKATASLTDPRLADLVEKDYQEGVARGIAHTPTILVNGRPFIETFPVEDVAKAIDAELAAAK